MSLIDKVNTFEGNITAENLKVAIIISRFNEFITSKLLNGAVDSFTRLGGDASNIDVYWVPGAMEIGGVCARLTDSKKYEGIVCLGTVIRGDTPHFDYVASESAKAVAALSKKGLIPIIYGIITTDTIEQAIERAGTKRGNKGSETMINLIEMINLYAKLPNNE